MSNEKNILLIPAAGKATRLNGEIKAMKEINGIPNLINTVNLTYHLYDKIVIMLNSSIDYNSIADEFFNYFEDEDPSDVGDLLNKHLEIILMDESKGCGDAVLEGLEFIYKSHVLEGFNPSEIYTTILWGDAHLTSKDPAVQLLRNKDYLGRADKDNLMFSILATPSQNPYCYIVTDIEEGFVARDIKFKSEPDYEMSDGSRWHDQSMFMVYPVKDGVHLYDILVSMRESLGWTKESPTYNTDTGQMRFLNVVKYITENYRRDEAYVDFIHYMEENGVFSYNTEEDLNIIKEFYKEEEKFYK